MEAHFSVLDQQVLGALQNWGGDGQQAVYVNIVKRLGYVYCHKVGLSRAMGGRFPPLLDKWLVGFVDVVIAEDRAAQKAWLPLYLKLERL